MELCSGNKRKGSLFVTELMGAVNHSRWRELPEWANDAMIWIFYPNSPKKEERLQKRREKRRPRTDCRRVQWGKENNQHWTALWHLMCFSRLGIGHADRTQLEKLSLLGWRYSVAAGLWGCQSVSFSTSLTWMLLAVGFLWKRGKGREPHGNTKASCCKQTTS